MVSSFLSDSSKDGIVRFVVLALLYCARMGDGERGRVSAGPPGRVVLAGFRTQGFILGYSRSSLRERLAKVGDSVVTLRLRGVELWSPGLKAGPFCCRRF